MTLAGDQWAVLLRSSAEAVSDHLDELTALDAVVGDGDHGVNLRAGMEAVVARLDHDDAQSASETLVAAGEAIQRSMAGAAGLLFGRFFVVGGEAVDDRFDGAAVAIVLDSGTTEVRRRGKAAVGDRSMVDALVPAAAAATAVAAGGSDPAAVLAAASEAAEAGAARTAAMRPNVGRAARATTEATGRPDAGATSVAVILAAWAAVVRRNGIDV